MVEDNESERSGSGYASPPCMAAEIAPDYFDPLAVDPQQARDVARWRTAERIRLREARKQLRADERLAVAAGIIASLRDLLHRRWGGTAGRTISFYWPIKDEPDLRPLMADLHAVGVRIALPLVETRAAPLVFRDWTPETRMQRGFWNIPVPPSDAPVVGPDLVLAPLVGWDGAGYRLGYGGGYFDRTLAAMTSRPITVGVGFQASRLATIFPQPHDIPLEVIVTEHGVQYEREQEKGP